MPGETLPGNQLPDNGPTIPGTGDYSNDRNYFSTILNNFRCVFHFTRTQGYVWDFRAEIILKGTEIIVKKRVRYLRIEEARESIQEERLQEERKEETTGGRSTWHQGTRKF